MKLPVFNFVRDVKAMAWQRQENHKRTSSRASNVTSSRDSHPSRKGGAQSEAPDSEVFWAYVRAGKRLAEIHVEYEKQKQFKLKEQTKDPLDWRVTKMRLNKETGTLVYNETLTLSGIPKEVYDYKLGNRSALEWVVDQYQVSTDKRSGIENDPNREDDPEYIYRLIGQVITVSLETAEIAKSLPGLGLPTNPPAKDAQVGNPPQVPRRYSRAEESARSFTHTRDDGT